MKEFDVNKLKVASPCPAGWEEMSGDNRSRFCELCQLNVYNFSEMTTVEIENLIRQKEGRLCGRLYRRADGTVLTKDCPKGLQLLRKRLRRTATAVFATIIGLSSIVFGQTEKEKSCKVVSQGKITRFESKSEFVVVKGVVSDLQGAIIANVKITLLNLETKQTFETTSDKDGEFKLKNIPSGKYQAVFEAEVFQRFEVKKLELNKNESVKFEIFLRPTLETVIVGIIFEERLLDVTSSSLKTVINKKQIETLPYKK